MYVHYVCTYIHTYIHTHTCIRVVRCLFARNGGADLAVGKGLPKKQTEIQARGRHQWKQSMSSRQVLTSSMRCEGEVFSQHDVFLQMPNLGKLSFKSKSGLLLHNHTPARSERLE